MRTSKKIVIGAVSLILAVVVAWFAYYLIHYLFYNEYRENLSSYEYEEGTEFTPIKEASSDVEGMVLAQENDNLKLYVNTQSGEMAVVEKRSGKITYSNPVNADDDAIANETNKNYMKSQLIVNYFNTERIEGTYDSYSFCTSRDQLAVEGIEGGVRFLYTIGDMTSETGIVPQYISQATLDDVLSKLSEKDAKFVAKKFVESNVADGYLEMLESTKKKIAHIQAQSSPLCKKMVGQAQSLLKSVLIPT